LPLDQSTEFLTENVKLLNNVQEPEECRKAINIFVDKIIVYPDYFDPVYKFPMLPSDADVNGGGEVYLLPSDPFQSVNYSGFIKLISKNTILHKKDLHEWRPFLQSRFYQILIYFPPRPNCIALTVNYPILVN
jgi:hypothetical protein